MSTLEEKILSGQNNFIKDYTPAEELTESETKELEEKLEQKLIKSKNRFGFLKHINALRKYLINKDVKWYRKSVVVAAIIYFITPVDAIPDFAPFLGYLDDIGVIAWTIKFLGEEIRSYY